MSVHEEYRVKIQTVLSSITTFTRFFRNEGQAGPPGFGYALTAVEVHPDPLS